MSTENSDMLFFVTYCFFAYNKIEMYVISDAAGESNPAPWRATFQQTLALIKQLKQLIKGQANQSVLEPVLGSN